MPDLSDIDALEAIYHAQKQFDEKLKSGFQSKFEELGDLGYPGVTDPKLDISTKIKPIDGLNHSSALKYRVAHHDESTDYCHSLPEQSNGLGYQNLISMVFRLMSFRDDWMQVGKMGKKAAIKSDDDLVIPPLHLVLVEEPEAHLHAQVQQVFIREAYKILRKHSNLGQNNSHTTQLTISTHSSHIAHECEFSYLRYFRRKPAECVGEVPISTVINLSEVFGKDEETERFVTRYIKTTHCDLFFADAAILIEGSAERILVPHFIREHFPELSRSYLTLLEINGSHAHRLRPLIEHLGLTTLIVADLDSVNPASNNSSIQPARKQNLTTKNETLKTWLPEKFLIDELLDLNDDFKVKEYDPLFCIRVAYQCPIMTRLNAIKAPEEFLSRTFEDALVFENIDIFKDFGENGLAKKFKTAINQSNDIESLGQEIFKALQGTSDKAGFALDILCMKDLKNLKVPTYLNEGLAWLQEKMSIKNKDKIIVPTPRTDQTGEIS